MLYNRHDPWTGMSFGLYGEYSEGEAELMRGLLFPGAVALDVGANVGALTIPMADAVGPRGTVLAFEPQRLIYYILVANVALRSYQHVYPHWLALGHMRGKVDVPLLDYDVDNNFGGLSLDADAPKIDARLHQPVDIIPLDDLALTRCDFIKADVEGMEVDVLKGGAGTIAQHKPTLYLEADRPHKQRPLLEQLDRMGYDAYWHTPPLFNPGNYRGVTENRFVSPSGEPIVSINWLCVHRSKGVTLRGTRVEMEALP